MFSHSYKKYKTEESQQKKFTLLICDKDASIVLPPHLEYLVECYQGSQASTLGVPDQDIQKEKFAARNKFYLARFIAALVSDLQIMMAGQTKEIKEKILKNNIEAIMDVLKEIYLALFGKTSFPADITFWKKLETALTSGALRHCSEDKIINYCVTWSLLKCFLSHKKPSDVGKILESGYLDKLRRVIDDSNELERAEENSRIFFKKFHAKLYQCFESKTCSDMGYLGSTMSLFLFIVSGLCEQKNYIVSNVLRIAGLLLLCKTVKRYKLKDELKEKFIKHGADCFYQYMSHQDNVPRLLLVEEEERRHIMRVGIMDWLEQLENQRCLKMVGLGSFSCDLSLSILVPSLQVQSIPAELDFCKLFEAEVKQEEEKLQREVKIDFIRVTPANKF